MKQQFTKHINGRNKANKYWRSFKKTYFYNDTIDLKNVDAKLLKIDKKSYKNIDIYTIGYITIKKIDDYESIYSVNPLYLLIGYASGYLDEKNGNKYLIFDSVDENKEVLKNMQMFGMELKTK